MTITALGPITSQEPAGDFLAVLNHQSLAIRLDRASPRIVIDADLVEEIRAGNWAPSLTLTGDVLRLDLPPHRVVYRLGEPHPTRHAYYAEWPD